jgi:hypothetical protein
MWRMTWQAISARPYMMQQHVGGAGAGATPADRAARGNMMALAMSDRDFNEVRIRQMLPDLVS